MIGYIPIYSKLSNEKLNILKKKIYDCNLFLCVFLLKGLTCFLSYAIFAAVLGMFQFGYNTGVINAPQSVQPSTIIIQNLMKFNYYTRI